MESWFIFALGGMVLAGVSNFMFKVAAKRGHDSNTFTLYGGVVSLLYIVCIALLMKLNLSEFSWLTGVLFVGGLLASTTNIFKVQALRYIDTTIYFPLFKLLAPAIAVAAGYVFFEERFTSMEWLGIFVGLTVPLLLISKTEGLRQQNLASGLILVVITSCTSAISAVLFKFGVDGGVNIAAALLYATLGIIIGSIVAIIYKQGVRQMYSSVVHHTNLQLVWDTSIRAVLITTSFGLILYAYELGGLLGIVQTINSFYILVPIVLAVIIYSEHLNTQKIIAIILSVASLVLLG